MDKIKKTGAFFTLLSVVKSLQGLITHIQKFTFIFLVCFTFSPALRSQDKQPGDTTKKKDTAAKNAKPAVLTNNTDSQSQKPSTNTNSPVVYEVYRLGYEKEPEKRNSAGIGDIIILKVRNLKNLLNRSLGLDTNGVKTSSRPQPIRLFIDGRKIDSLSPESGAPQKDEGELRFHLQRNPTNDEAWADILGSPRLGDGFTYHEATISVGLENEYAEDSEVKNFHITRVRPNWFWFCLIAFSIYLYFLIRSAQRTNLLRDREIDATILGIPKNVGLTPFSLGRIQMAFWFTLVVLSFLFIWLITGAYDIITSGILVLIGISVGTSLSAATIDNSKGQEIVNKTSGLIAEQNVLHSEISALLTSINTSPAPANLVDLQDNLYKKQVRMKEIQPEISNNLNVLKPKKSRGFMLDILTDATGYSFHRLQMFVWTIVLGILFIYSVWTRLSMPEFSATLLALQGITAGTYLGFKIPEKQT